jgi:signal peptidase I
MSSPAERRGPERHGAIAATCAVAGLLGAVAVAAALGRPRRVVVRGASMAPTLVEGDRLLVVRRRTLAPGDVVAVRDPRDRSQLLVKRVGVVGSGAVTVLGDNAAASSDSRVFGPVPRGDVIGTVVRRYAPAARQGPVNGAPGGTIAL